MNALHSSVGYSLGASSVQMDLLPRLHSQTCDVVQVINRKGVAPALGHLSIAFAEGNDILGYAIHGTKYKVALLTSPSRENLLRKKLRARIEKLEHDGHLKIVNSNRLGSLGEYPSSHKIAQRLDGVLMDADIVIIDGYGSNDRSNQLATGFASAGLEGAVADYFIASVAEHAYTIFVGQGCCAGAFKRWDPNIAFDNVLSIYRCNSKSEPLRFLIYWEKGSAGHTYGDDLMVNWRAKNSAGEYAWELLVGAEDVHLLYEFAKFLRCLGMAYQHIGDLLGRGRSTVHKWLTSPNHPSRNKFH